MATTEFIAAIELGSSKITGVAGKKNSDGSMQVLAYAQEDSSTFIRKGVIFNLDKTAQSLTSIINRLEGELKNSIAKVYVGIGGQSLRTVRNVVSRDLEEEAIISEELVSAIGDENIAIPVVDMDILDVAPQEYKVGNNLQANPVGLVGSHIEGRFLNIVARASVRKNLEHCFQQAKIDIADQLIAPLVTANAVLTESERRSGCALIDFGADTTTISVYKNNILRFLTVLPLGGNSITHDFTTLQMEEEEAERLKKAYGDALYEEDPEQEEATCKLDDDNRIIKVADLNNIIEARAEEIVANVWNQIQLSSYEDKLLAGIILTGGAANLKNLDETLRKRSKIEKIRMAKLPRNTVHAPNNILKKDGSQNTLFGLLFEGNQNCCLTETAPQAAPAPSVSKPEPEVHKTVDMFEDDQELKEQARIARLKKEEEEREAKLAAKEAEKLRKQKEKEEKGIYPIGKKMERISTKSLERELSKHPLIDEAECYKTPSGKVCVEVTQRIPILRVMSANGQNYYLDNKGTIMPPEAKCVAHRVIVTGNVEKSFAMKDLYKFGVFLHNNKFWDAQIEQIHVLPDQNIELVPRVGDHLVYLGKLENFEDKLARLKEFYKKGLNRVGWNKYSRINLEFSNQIICTKRE